MNPHASTGLPLSIKEIPNLRGIVAQWRADGDLIGFVPTMGALHEGHLTLVREAKKHCRRVIVSIFVNPTQFGPNEDFSSYPRMEQQDIDLLASVSADLAWLPGEEDIYPAGSTTHVSVGESGKVLCGAHRPGHFNGVATVVTMLLNSVRPDMSFFGEKDYQQLSIIKRIVADLHLPGEVIGVPTVREKDGLALSSRNRYLNIEERAKAPEIYATLLKIQREAVDEESLRAALARGRQHLEEAGFVLDYLDALDERYFTPLLAPTLHGRLFVAARLGTTRLIDNLSLVRT